MFAMGPAFFRQAGGGYAALAVTGAFDAATVGVAYSSSRPVTGGLEPYTLTGGTGIISGSLDAGFTLSITGSPGAYFLTLACASPATADTMTFTASVDSADGQTATSTQSVVVSAASLAASIYAKIVGWWERDEASGTTMVDAHTNALNGTYTGLTVNQAGLASNLNKSVQFPTGNNYANVPATSLLSIPGDLSCVVWIQRTGTQAAFSKLMWKPSSTLSSGQANYVFQMSSGGSVIFRVSVGGVNIDAGMTGSVADATPTMLGGRRAGTELVSFVNGVKQTPVTLSSGAILDRDVTSSLNWGYNGSGSDPFVGYQDQSAVFSPALTDAEFAYLYNSGAGISYAALKTASGH